MHDFNLFKNKIRYLLAKNPLTNVNGFFNLIVTIEKTI